MGSAALLLALGLIGVASGGDGLQPLPQPRPVPDFRLPGIDGKEHRLSDYRGRYLLVNFWAAWCIPCRLEMPSLERLHRRFGGDGFELIAIHVGPELHRAGKLADELGLGFPIMVDEDVTLGGWGVPGLPTTYLLDPQGLIVAAAVGERDWDSPAMVEAIRRWIGQGVDAGDGDRAHPQ
jgi:peroxiredoxin